MIRVLFGILVSIFLIPSIAFGEAFTTPNLVVGETSGNTNHASGATFFLKINGTTSAVTGFVVEDSNGKTLLKMDGTGMTFLWFSAGTSIWPVGNELYTNKADGTTVHLNP